MGSESELKEGWRGFLGRRLCNAFPSLRVINRDQPLPPWNDADVQHFIASDPVYGPSLENAREAAKVSAVGSLIGALSTAGVAWKYSKSLHGTGLSLLAGGIFGWSFGHEIANHYYQLYKLDVNAANHKFLDWWEKKCQGKY